MSTQHNEKQLPSTKMDEKSVSAGKTSVSLNDKDKFITEGKTTVRPLAQVIQKKKILDSPILIAGFPDQVW
jgi:hypothetical protein